MIYMTVEPNDVYAIVGINATILSIIIGFISAFALYIFSKVREFEIQIMQEAEKINLIPQNLPTLIISRGNVDTRDVSKRTQVLERLRDISMDIPNATMYSKSMLAEFKSLGPNHGPQLNASEVGKEARVILTIIFKSYPFANINPTYRPDGEPITMVSASQAQEWAKDMESVLMQVMWCLESHGRKLQNVVNSYAEESAILSNPNNEFSIEHYCYVGEKMKEILRSVKLLIAQAEARKPNSGVIMAGVIISFIGIICGVVCPMINKNTPPVIFVYIPVLCYSLIFVYILRFLIKTR